MEFKQTHKIEINQLNGICDLIHKFILNANENEAKIHHIYQELVFNLENGFVFVAIENDRIIGILSCSRILIHGWLDSVFVHFISIDSDKFGISRTKLFIEFAIDEVKKVGIERIMFNTRRDEDAFIRLLPREWKKDSVTLRLCA